MKVTAFVGSARKKHTYYAVERFMHTLQSLGNIEYEIVSLSDCRLNICKGCKQCLDRGEERCSLKDDRDLLIEKMNHSDGVVFASPNYSFNVSGFMKIFLDRLGYIFHRPRYFGKTFTGIVVEGIYGGKKIMEYFDFIGKGLGFNVVNSCCLNSLEPMTEKDQKKFNSIIDRQSKKFYRELVKKSYPVPGFFDLMVFRMARTSIGLTLDESWRDYTYYRENGWFKSGYYYPAPLNPVKKLTGIFFDLLFTRIYGKKASGKQVKPA
ncbi:MAG: flavodoxin family protein [Calditrichaceae bacterium]|nr:flavodoxin family protein [Calditrichaceae bacterium]MBN2709694.1 flavodoxin family protein [Calditrichaceae bacterium]RQV94477.1 MAG: flavodoxin family protein [Calditrichota bacterium]